MQRKDRNREFFSFKIILDFILEILTRISSCNISIPPKKEYLINILQDFAQTIQCKEKIAIVSFFHLRLTLILFRNFLTRICLCNINIPPKEEHLINIYKILHRQLTNSPNKTSINNIRSIPSFLVYFDTFQFVAIFFSNEKGPNAFKLFKHK